MPSAVVHGPGHSPGAGPETAQVGVASKVHRSMGRRDKTGPHGGCIVLLFGCISEPPSTRRVLTRRVLTRHVPYLPLAPRELGLAFFDKSLDGLFMVCSGEAVFLQR